MNYEKKKMQKVQGMKGSKIRIISQTLVISVSVINKVTFISNSA